MVRADHTFAISLGVSLIAHAALLSMLAGRGSRVVSLPAIATPSKTASIYIDDRRDASLTFGTADGKGSAANASPGELPMVGRDADQAQAFLSRDPQGPGKVGDDPSMSVLPQVANASPQGSQTQVAMVGVGDSARELAPPQNRVTPPIKTRGEDQTTLVRTKSSPAPSDESAAPGATPLGSSKPAADPAIMSDSESDPFTPGMKVEFRDGRVDARLGRKVKTVRPKLTLAALLDLQATVYPSMTVRVTIDADGAVRDVGITKSSGSVGADEAVKVALYQWWFEPMKDSAGHAIASEVTFPITWR